MSDAQRLVAFVQLEFHLRVGFPIGPRLLPIRSLMTSVLDKPMQVVEFATPFTLRAQHIPHLWGEGCVAKRRQGGVCAKVALSALAPSC